MYNQLAVVLFACASVVFCNDLQLGTNYGRKIFDQKIEASPAIWKQVQKIAINTTKEEVISAVVVTDNRPDKDGVALIVEGGEGQKNVTIELQSPTVFRGFDFHVVVYGIQEDILAKYPGVTSNNTEVNASDLPKGTVNVTSEDVKPTVPSNADETPVEKEGPSPPVATGDQPRMNRDTEDQLTVDPIVLYVNPGPTTKDQDVTTDNAHKHSSTTVKPDETEEETSTDDENKTQTVTDHGIILPKEVSQDNDTDVKILEEQPTEYMEAPADDTDNIPKEKYQQNFDSISKELGQKVILGFRNQ